MNHGLEGKFVIKNKKKLRYGYTTGSCAAAAAQAAVRMLFSDEDIAVVKLETPKGIILYLEPVDVLRTRETVSCAIQKDAGDDPDVTDGIFIYAKVRRCSRAEAQSGAAVFSSSGRANAQTETADQNGENAVVSIRGGEGVGTVTLPGLEQPVGAPAINRVPREMIEAEVKKVCLEFDYHEGIEVTISAPAGTELAQKTFNPRLGIQGGISILGTSGIVEPMSEKALVATIETQMRQMLAQKKYLLVTPGNYGTEYLKGHFPFEAEDALKCSNYVGQTIDLAVNMECEGMLFVAHIGKFVKVAGGIMNTHSKEADARMEILASCALLAGVDADAARRILAAVTTDEGLRVLSETDMWDEAIQILIRRIGENLNRRAQDRMKVGAVIFSNVYGELGRTAEADGLIEKLLSESHL